MVVETIVDLREQLGEARDQKQRPTCMAFAASDGHAAARDSHEALSTEFAYFHAVRRRSPFNPHAGVSFALVAESIRIDGQPREAVWPYLPALPTRVADWKPPEKCSPIFRRRYQIETPSIERLYECLDESRPVVIAMSISAAFYSPSSNGVVSASADPPLNSHAVLAVGYGKTSASRVILIRNSWGVEWGLKGHVWLAEGYLKPRMLKIGTAELKEA
jgi:hypothetical protein